MPCSNCNHCTQCDTSEVSNRPNNTQSENTQVDSTFTVGDYAFLGFLLLLAVVSFI